MRASFTAPVVLIVTLVAGGCNETTAPTSPSSVVAGASAAVVGSDGRLTPSSAQGPPIRPILAQLNLVDNQIVSANRQLTLFFVPGNPVKPDEGDDAAERPAKPANPALLRNALSSYLKANAVLEREIEHLLTRPVGRPSHKPKVCYHSFQYQAKSWHQSRRVVAKIERHRGELFPRMGFIVTNLTWRSKNVVKFYNGRGTAEQWIKEGKNAIKWTKLSYRTFKDNQTRLQLFALAYNLGNFLRRLALPKPVRHWSLTTLREKLIKIGAKVTRHSKYVTFQLAEVAVTRNLFAAILDRIARLALPPTVVVGRMPA